MYAGVVPTWNRPVGLTKCMGRLIKVALGAAAEAAAAETLIGAHWKKSALMFRSCELPAAARQQAARTRVISGMAVEGECAIESTRFGTPVYHH